MNQTAAHESTTPIAFRIALAISVVSCVALATAQPLPTLLIGLPLGGAVAFFVRREPHKRS